MDLSTYQAQTPHVVLAFFLLALAVLGLVHFAFKGSIQLA